MGSKKPQPAPVRRNPPATSPPAPPPPVPPCVHRWVFLDTHQSTESGTYQIGWKRRDRFYCEKCLEQKDVVKEEWSREKPDWYR